MGFDKPAAIDLENPIQAYLTDLFYMYSNQIDTLRAVLGDNGITLQELAAAMAQVRAESIRGQKLRHKLKQRHQVIAITRSENQATCATISPTNPPGEAVQRVLSGLYKKKSRMLKKLNQIS